jgi:hypothetical protein
MGRLWPELWHTFPQEAGGSSLLQFKRAMMQDAASQEGLVGVLGSLLDKTIECNDQFGRVSKLAKFEAGTCHLSASAYLKRIMKYGGCSDCCVVVGLLYLQRLKQCVITLRLTSNNMQRLLLTSVMVASKFLDDEYHSNKHWALIGGLSLQELNTLELRMLFRMSFHLQVTRKEYDQYQQALGHGRFCEEPGDVVFTTNHHFVSEERKGDQHAEFVQEPDSNTASVRNQSGSPVAGEMNNVWMPEIPLERSTFSLAKSDCLNMWLRRSHSTRLLFPTKRRKKTRQLHA